MQKWMITYSFLIGFLSLIICGHTAADKKIDVLSYPKVIVKKTFPVAIENKNTGQADCYTINSRTRFLLATVHSLAFTENNPSLVLYYSCRDIVTARGVEKVLKDCLLHLFPSHYFW